jgi:low temperature requirement protein LtrA
MTSTDIVSPEDQSATFVELFFDLVFVFSVTQVVGLLHTGLGWASAGQAVLAFWLVWWAWTQFTWALNAANTTHPFIEMSTLVATALAFFMAIAIPEAFHGHGLRFAVPYVLVRLVGLVVYARVADATDPGQYRAVARFCTVSAGGLVAVVVGALVGGPAQTWIWALAIGLDVIAAAVGGQDESWNLHPEHFAERHGLFVIIALGETLIVAAGGASEAPSLEHIVVAAMAVAVTGALWWTYFPRAKPRLEHALATSRGARQSMLARDAYSLLHFPMLCGIVAYAVAIEAAVTHPGDPLPGAERLALALGLALFVGGMALALHRGTGHLPLTRAGLVLLTAGAVLAVPNVAPVATLAIALVGVAWIALIEQREAGEATRADHVTMA